MHTDTYRLGFWRVTFRHCIDILRQSPFFRSLNSVFRQYASVTTKNNIYTLAITSYSFITFNYALVLLYLLHLFTITLPILLCSVLLNTPSTLRLCDRVFTVGWSVASAALFCEVRTCYMQGYFHHHLSVASRVTR